MAKVKIDVAVINKKKETSVMTFNNTKELLGFLARTGAKVNKDKSITVA